MTMESGDATGESDIPYSTKYPIFLHKDHHLTKLLVLNAHQSVPQWSKGDTDRTTVTILDFEREKPCEANLTSLYNL